MITKSLSLFCYHYYCHYQHYIMLIIFIMFILFILFQNTLLMISIIFDSANLLKGEMS